MNTRKKNIVAGYTEPDKEDIWLNSTNNKLYFYSPIGWTEIGTSMPLYNLKKIICDTVYTLKNTGSIRNPKYVRVGSEVINCREVPEDCAVTYTSVVDKTNLKETITATHSCPVIQVLTPAQFEELGGVPVDVPIGETITIK